MFFHFIKIKDLSKNDFKSYKLLKKLNTKSEIVIVDDGCPQRSGYYAKEILKKKLKNVNIIFHKKNLGYGAAIKTGLKNCRYQWIFHIDGDRV